jgi:hypothetical protein
LNKNTSIKHVKTKIAINQYISILDSGQGLYGFGSRKQLYNALTILKYMKNENHAIDTSITRLARTKPGFFLNNETAAKLPKIKYRNVTSSPALWNAMPSPRLPNSINRARASRYMARLYEKKAMLEAMKYSATIVR